MLVNGKGEKKMGTSPAPWATPAQQAKLAWPPPHLPPRTLFLRPRPLPPRSSPPDPAPCPVRHRREDKAAPLAPRFPSGLTPALIHFSPLPGVPLSSSAPLPNASVAIVDVDLATIVAPTPSWEVPRNRCRLLRLPRPRAQARSHHIDRVEAIFFLGRRRCSSLIRRLCSS